MNKKLDNWLDKHPRLDTVYIWWRWHRPVIYWHRIQNWWEIRQWRPGQFFLDHGTHPMILIEAESDGNLRGISLVDGQERWSDLFNCGPEKVTEKEAKVQIPIYKQEEAYYTYYDNIESPGES